MALTKEQIEELKAQLSEQIQHLPPEQRRQAQEQIDSMSTEALETMLKQQQAQSQKIFRMIINKEIPSVLIAENPGAIAVLSVKSISKGHTLIIPKTAVYKESDLPKEVHLLSEEISKKLIESLKAKSTSIISERNFGEVIINVIPIYDKPLNLSSPRNDETVEELEKLKVQINIERIKKEPEKIEKLKIEKKPEEKPLKLRRRVP